MIVNDIDTIRYQAQTKLVELGVENHFAYEEGKLAENALEKGLSLISLLRALELKDYLSDEEKENILYCLVEISEINSFPLSPSLYPIQKPNILIGIEGKQGIQGEYGPPGKDYINVISNPLYDNIDITETDVAGVKTFSLGYAPYVVSYASMVITNGIYKEIGSSSSVNFTASINNGREGIAQQTITSPISPVWTSNPQTFSDNALVIMSRTTRTYTALVDDGTTIDTDSKNVEFLYPIFHGSSPTILTGLQVYANLAKAVSAIGDKSIAYNFTDEYAYFAFDSAYDDSNIKILDGNGFDVTTSFQMDLITVDSGTSLGGSGGTDWTKEYKVYRTVNLTDISNITYQFLNITE